MKPPWWAMIAGVVFSWAQGQDKVATEPPIPFSSATSLDRSEYQSLGAPFFPDQFRAVPGFEVQRLSAADVNLSVRGYNEPSSVNRGVLGLVDGRQVNNEFLGSVVWPSLEFAGEDIDWVQVIRGPGSFLYGPNAMHGVVNIVTRSPLRYEQPTLYFQGGYGTDGANRAILSYVRHDGDAGFKATLGWEDMNNFQDGSDADHKAFATLRLDSRIADDQIIGITFGTSRQKLDTRITSTSVVPQDDIQSNAEELFGIVHYEYQHLRVQVDWTRFTSASTANIFAPFQLNMDTVNLDLRHSLTPFQGLRVTFGGGYRYTTFATTNQDVTNGRHDIGIGWLFFQGEATLASHLWASAGFRWDRHSVVGDNYSPQAALVWEFEEKQNIRVSVCTGFRDPAIRELYLDMNVMLNGMSFVFAGNKGLRSEQMHSFELAYAGEPVERLSVELTGYFNLIDDLDRYQVVGTTVTGSTVVAPVSLDDEYAFGTEAEIRIKLAEGLDGFANYSLGFRYSRNTGQRKLDAPMNKGNVGMRWSHEAGIKVSLWANFFDSVTFSTAQGSVPIPAYGLLNMRASYEIPIGAVTGRLFALAFNMLDYRHREHPQGDSYGVLALGGVEIVY